MAEGGHLLCVLAEWRGVGRSDQLECVHAVRCGDVLYSDRWDGSCVCFTKVAFLGTQLIIARGCEVRPSQCLAGMTCRGMELQRLLSLRCGDVSYITRCVGVGRVAQGSRRMWLLTFAFGDRSFKCTGVRWVWRWDIFDIAR